MLPPHLSITNNFTAEFVTLSLEISTAEMTPPGNPMQLAIVHQF